MIPLLLLVFMLSGAAGLFYESVWSRYLSLFVGHSAYAQVITLVLFLGGMALGSLLVSRRTERIRDPLYTYALIELVVGGIGMIFHDAIYLPVTSWAYASVFPALAGGPGLVVAKWVIAGLLILPQSILLGATFPLMSAGVMRRIPGQPGLVLGSLYFANSFGAAMGVLIAGFFLFQWVGLPGTLQAAAILNLLVALAGILISRLRPIPVLNPSDTTGLAADDPADSAAPLPPRPPAPTPALPALPQLTRLLLAISVGTAIASFIYEIAWIRLLSLVIGSATHSFELMLSAFILGLALGALWVRRRADSFKDPLRTLAVVQLWMGGLAIMSLALYSSSFTWAAELLAAVARTNQGYVAFSIAKYAICLAIMLPATFCAGITLPLITRTLLWAGGGEGSIGKVYGINTFGSIIGIAAAGLVLMPLIGLKYLLLLGGMLDMAIGVMILVVLSGLRPGTTATRAAVVAIVATVVIVIGAGVGVRLDPGMMASAVFRQGAAALGGERTMLYQADGRTATVHAFQSGRGGGRIISTNGKPDGSLAAVWFTGCTTDGARVAIGGDDATQMLLGVMPSAFRPDARSAAVIGHGTGMSSHFMLAQPTLETLTTIEIEPRMVDGSRVFEPANRRVFEDPRSRHVFDDAKSHFAATNQRYDIILSEPSNPWVSGVSGLFTEEFYRRVVPYLAPGGVFGQWLHAYELSDALVLSVLAALDRSFSDYRVYAVSSHDIIVIAVAKGTVPAPDWRVARQPGLDQDLCHFHPLRPADMDAALIADKAGLQDILTTVRSPNSDFFPVLDLGAERTRFAQRAANGVMGLAEGPVPLGLAAGGAPLEPDTVMVTALASLLGPRTRAQAAWLRRFAWGPPVVAAPRFDWDETPLFRHTDFRRSLESDRPPSSWRLWALLFAQVSNELHAGTRQWTDEPLFDAVTSYLERARAPTEPRDVVALYHALSRGDHLAAVEPVRRLVEAARGGALWLPPEDLLDAAVVVRLGAGDGPGARAAYDLLRPRTSRAGDHARMLALAARLRAAGVLDTPR